MSLQLKFYDIWDEAREEGLEAGRAEGLEAGRTEGLELGRTEGRAEGLTAGKLQQLIELVKDGDLSLEKAIQKSGVSRKEFIELMESYNE